MNKIRIIHILGHSPGKGAYKDINNPSVPLPQHYVKTNYPPYWVGFFEDDFYVMTAKEINQRSDKYINECWRPYLNCKEVYSKTIDGIIHRVFPSIPSKKITWWRDFPIYSEYSPDLAMALKKIIKEENVIVHFHGFPGGTNNYILENLDLHSVPVLVQHRGSSFRHERYINSNSFTSQLFYLIHKFYDKFKADTFFSKNIDLFLSLSKHELRTFKRMNLTNRLYMRDGRNFNKFPLGNKVEARKKLGFDINKKIVLYVGNYSEHRGVDKIVNVFNSLKSRKDIKFIFIGGSQSDKFFELVRKSDALHVPRINRDELMVYYHASDLTINIDSDFVQKYNGLSGVPMEGIACGIPSVSRSLTNFVGTDEELVQLGEIPFTDSESVVEKCVLQIIDNPKKYSKCGEIIRKYYDVNVTINKNLKIYDLYAKKYYN